MKTKQIKLMIIENFIDYITTDEQERRDMKQGADIYVEEDHVDEIVQAFPEIVKPNGFASWQETHFEIVDYFSCSADIEGSMSQSAREEGGRTLQYTLAEALTNEFETRYAGETWEEKDFFDCVDEFLQEKEMEYKEL